MSRAKGETRPFTTESGDARPPIILELDKRIKQLLVRFELHTITGFWAGMNNGLGVTGFLSAYG
tara:strand:- start:279 stop:470 length:192 start_codon:yes stop_codon:yes gene_type:complete